MSHEQQQSAASEVESSPIWLSNVSVWESRTFAKCLPAGASFGKPRLPSTMKDDNLVGVYAPIGVDMTRFWEAIDGDD